MHDIDPPTPSEAAAIAHDPNATPEQLSQVAEHHPDLDAVVAAHPNAYSDLLDWLAQYGSEAAQQTVAARRAAQDPEPTTPTATPESPAGDPTPAETPSPAPTSANPELATSDTANAVPPPPGPMYPPPPLMAPIPAPQAKAKVAAPLLILGVTTIGIITVVVVLVMSPVLTWLGLRQSATSAPSYSFGEPTYASTTQATAGLPSCPSGSVQLAYATFPDGWVLVCGIDAATPTQWYSSDSGGELESTSVSYDPTSYRYTAQFSDGSSGWLNHTPGVFGHTGSSGQILTQRSVGQIWFVTLDGGSSAPSSAPSTGPFGVPLPQATAEDQVRYLSALLQKSAAARKALQPAVIAVRECENGSNGDYSSQVSTISSVTDNRKELLSALETAPVDKVPNGTALVSELRTALSYSLRADQAYLTWATAVNSSGCGSGSEAEGTKNSKRAGTAKETFVKHWNSQIAGSFNAPKFTRDQL